MSTIIKGVFFVFLLIVSCSTIMAYQQKDEEVFPENKADFEKAFLKEVGSGTFRIIKVNMAKSVLIDDKKEHFVINKTKLDSYVNYKVETVEKDGYIAVSNSKIQGNQCAFIANSDKPLYIWQSKRFSIITQSNDREDPYVLEKPYCQSFILPPNSYYKVSSGYYEYHPDIGMPIIV